MGSSGSSLGGQVAADTYYTNDSWLDGRYGEVGKVYVRVVSVAGGHGAHHCIVVDLGNNDDKWRVFEWNQGGLGKYATKRIYGKMCKYLGRHELKQVYRAALDVSRGRSYSSSFNCNHWTDAVVYKLGYEMYAKWDCSWIANFWMFPTTCTLWTPARDTSIQYAHGSWTDGRHDEYGILHISFDRIAFYTNDEHIRVHFEWDGAKVSKYASYITLAQWRAVHSNGEPQDRGTRVGYFHKLKRVHEAVVKIDRYAMRCYDCVDEGDRFVCTKCSKIRIKAVAKELDAKLDNLDDDWSSVSSFAIITPTTLNF